MNDNKNSRAVSLTAADTTLLQKMKARAAQMKLTTPPLMVFI